MCAYDSQAVGDRARRKSANWRTTKVAARAIVGQSALELSRASAHSARMTLRERWTSDIRCDDCGRSGTAVISEEDHPNETGSTGKRVEACPLGFEVAHSKDASEGIRIICSCCKTVVYGPDDRITA